jgi:vancomycin resistance protein YoaR
MWKKKISSSVDLLFAGILVFIILVSVVGIVFELKYLGRIYPGIKIADANVGGMTYKEAIQVVDRMARSTDQIVLRWGVNEWTQQSVDMGITYNVAGSIDKAFFIGRNSDIFHDSKTKLESIFQGRNSSPSLIVNEDKLKAAIDLISSQISVPVKEPEIFVRGSFVEISAGENGQRVDEKSLTQKVILSFNNFDKGKIDIPVVEMKPKLSEDQIKNAKQKAEAILGKKFILKNEGGSEKWDIPQDQVLSWIDLKSGEWSYYKIQKWIEELAPTFDTAPQNATFRFVGSGKVEEFKPAKNGRNVVVDQTVTKIIDGLNNLLISTAMDTVNVNIVVSEKTPEVSNEEVNKFGINELIGKGESWFSGSINNRIFNLKKAAEAINGVLVAPEEIFSFNKAVGEISAETGYKQAYIIKEGKTILGDGGGVCQVSSTLFRAILASGLPIEERTAHAYRVHYYEEKYQPGFDATVFQPNPDFKFKNDTGAYILIQTVYDEKTKYLSFELYGTSDGRRVEVSKSRIWEVTPPPPDLYQDDPTLPMGKVVQTEHAAWGAKVAFDWKVTRGEEVLQQRTFYSNYRSWQAVYLRGTKPI